MMRSKTGELSNLPATSGFTPTNSVAIAWPAADRQLVTREGQKERDTGLLSLLMVNSLELNEVSVAKSERIVN